MTRQAPQPQATRPADRRKRLALAPLLVAIALATCAAAVPASAAAKAEHRRLVLSPKPGKKYHSHPVRLKVRAHRHDEVRARLNGVKVGTELAEDRGGMRRVILSASHGLRHGRNVLRVRVHKFHGGRVRKRKIHFRVARGGPLAAAGRDRSLSPGARIMLNGHRSRAMPAALTRRLRYRWKILSRPRHSASTAKRRGARKGGGRPLLRRRRSARPVVRPRTPGDYRLRLKVIGPRGRVGTDRITLTVAPPPALRVDTMAKDSQGRWGIRVGKSFYPAKPRTWLQVVVIDRSTGVPRSNKSYDCPSSQGSGWMHCARRVVDDLGKPKNAIVIASNQPDAPGTSGAPHGAAAALVALKVPNQPFPAGNDLVRGTYSAIGTVGGPHRGHTATTNKPGAGSIEGLLIRNVNKKYTFSTADRVTFDTQAPGSDTDTNVIRVGTTNYTANVGDSFDGGFHVVVVDRRTLAGKSYWFRTHDAKGQGALNVFSRMRDTLVGAINTNKIVFLASRGGPLIDGKAYEGLAVSHKLYRAISSVADAITRLGGTRTAFYKLIDPGLYLNGSYFPHATYTLVGRRSGTGQGEEGYGAPGIDAPDLNSLPLGGTLTRTTADYGYAVDQTFNEKPSGAHKVHNPAQKLIAVVQGPDTPWPDAGDKGRAAAIAWIGRQIGFTDDPRAQYYTLAYGATFWKGKQRDIRSLRPDDLPAGVTRADFDWARDELIQEIDWLGLAYDFVAKLAAPYKDAALTSWADLQDIAKNINHDVVKADDGHSAGVIIGALFDGVRAMAEALPGVGEAFLITNAIYDTALRIAGVFDGNQDPDTRFQTTVGKAGEDLANRLRDGEKTLTESFFDVIAADYGKLRTVARCAKLLRSCPDDPTDWQITQDQLDAIGDGLRATLRNTFYGTLLPAKYTLWAIPDRRPYQQAADWQGHGAFGWNMYPFKGVPESANLFVPYCRDLGDHARRDEWQVYAVGSRWGLGTATNAYHMELPEAKVTDPLFTPVDPSKFPKGGLGNNKEAFYLRYITPYPLHHYPWKTSPMNWRQGTRSHLYLMCSE